MFLSRFVKVMKDLKMSFVQVCQSNEGFLIVIWSSFVKVMKDLEICDVVFHQHVKVMKNL